MADEINCKASSILFHFALVILAFTFFFAAIFCWLLSSSPSGTRVYHCEKHNISLE